MEKILKKPHHFYIINHMDDFLYEWSLCEYLQIDKYLRDFKGISLILSNSQTFFEYTSEKNNILLNKKHLNCLLTAKTQFNFLKFDINYYVKSDGFLKIPQKTTENQQFLDENPDINPSETLSKSPDLNISENPLTAVETLSKTPDLNISENPLKDVEPLSKSPDLNISENPLKDVHKKP